MTKDMTQGSPLKLILAFAVPLMLGSLFQQFYNLAPSLYCSMPRVTIMPLERHSR